LPGVVHGATVLTRMTFFLLLLLAGALGSAWWLRSRLRVVQAERERERRDERVRAAAERHEQTTRLDAVLDGMIEGLIVLDAEGRIAKVNRSAEQMFHFSRMMVGGTLLEAIRHHEIAALATRAVGAERAIEHEVRIESPQVRIVQISAAALRDPQGAPAGAVLVFHDVTQLRRLEAMRQDFVANVSHELRTPLSLIKSAAETLIDGAKDDPVAARRFLEIIDKQSSRLTLLIDDLLLLARLDSDRVEMHLESLDLHRAAQEALDDAAERAQRRGVTLYNSVPPALRARADVDRLRQVLSNLVDNAIKYGRAAGQVVVRGRQLDAGWIELSVHDDGPGIPVESLPRVFERFYRVDKARSREQGGTGLGLAIVKNVVQAHGGEVRVESEAGQGTAFFARLPAG
jgi:two-component system phosphate regulon sensor histidine kinase PhoR